MAASRWCFTVATLVLASICVSESSASAITYDKGLKSSDSMIASKNRHGLHPSFNKYGNDVEDLIILREILRGIEDDDDDDDDDRNQDGRRLSSAASSNSRRVDKRFMMSDSRSNVIPGKFGRDRLDKSANSRNKWMDQYNSGGGSAAETRFPLPERRQFPEVDWRGFNEDVFHESFGDFSPVKRWKKSSSSSTSSSSPSNSKI